MNSSLVAISTLVKSDIDERCLIIFLMNISSTALRYYLKVTNIYCSISSKKITNYTEMIVYGCITNKLNKIEHISIKEANDILKENKIVLKSLPGYGNAE